MCGVGAESSVKHYSEHSEPGRTIQRLAATPTLRLNRRTFDRAERAKDAAVAPLGPEQHAAFRALILTSVRRHRLQPREPAFGAGQYGFEYRLLAHRCFTEIAHDAQVIPDTDSITVLVSANTEVAKSVVEMKNAESGPMVRFMVRLLNKKVRCSKER